MTPSVCSVSLPSDILYSAQRTSSCPSANGPKDHGARRRLATRLRVVRHAAISRAFCRPTSPTTQTFLCFRFPSSGTAHERVIGSLAPYSRPLLKRCTRSLSLGQTNMGQCIFVARSYTRTGRACSDPGLARSESGSGSSREISWPVPRARIKVKKKSSVLHSAYSTDHHFYCAAGALNMRLRVGWFERAVPLSCSREAGFLGLWWWHMYVQSLINSLFALDRDLGSGPCCIRTAQPIKLDAAVIVGAWRQQMDRWRCRRLSDPLDVGPRPHSLFALETSEWLGLIPDALL
ncbi:hypothetical protein B0T17DRAFT_303810 [Bombardia bombarda]|uniref:Uncharacterized protein n=1 Tax=Bombardia bombarda TaxID=252184 RepID=A0AA39WUC4_9PEZI|nr:hypothetical protein B0T17DRAFT_303810 [Bombardia bombarda]